MIRKPLFPAAKLCALSSARIFAVVTMIGACRQHWGKPPPGNY